jgi:hypothetical protein
VTWYEALLATFSILLWHFYMVIFDPLVYPMDLAWLNGKVPADHYQRARPQYFRSLEPGGSPIRSPSGRVHRAVRRPPKTNRRLFLLAKTNGRTYVLIDLRGAFVLAGAGLFLHSFIVQSKAIAVPHPRGAPSAWQRSSLRVAFLFLRH